MATGGKPRLLVVVVVVGWRPEPPSLLGWNNHKKWMQTKLKNRNKISWKKCSWRIERDSSAQGKHACFYRDRENAESLPSSPCQTPIPSNETPPRPNKVSNPLHEPEIVACPRRGRRVGKASRSWPCACLFSLILIEMGLQGISSILRRILLKTTLILWKFASMSWQFTVANEQVSDRNVNLVIKQQVGAQYHSANALISLQNGSTMHFRINKTTPLKRYHPWINSTETCPFLFAAHAWPSFAIEWRSILGLSDFCLMGPCSIRTQLPKASRWKMDTKSTQCYSK